MTGNACYWHIIQLSVHNFTCHQASSYKHCANALQRKNCIHNLHFICLFGNPPRDKVVSLQYFKKQKKPVVEFELLGALIHLMSKQSNNVSQSFLCSYNKPVKIVVCEGKIKPWLYVAQ